MLSGDSVCILLCQLRVFARCCIETRVIVWARYMDEIHFIIWTCARSAQLFDTVFGLCSLSIEEVCCWCQMLTVEDSTKLLFLQVSSS
jgi:hypothetical protein